MSKKAGKKAKVKVPEIDPNSIEEVARKQSEAYDLVQRAMIRSQIDVELTTRDDLVKQKAELETKARQQSQEQSDIYQYLRNKLKDNYVAIAELENQVSHAHDERLMREKQLLTAIKNLNEERESEKERLEERLASLEVELTAIKEYQENSDVYEQTLKEMEAKITGCKDAFHVEVALLSTQLEEEWETGRRDKEERRKTTKKAAAKATQEQLGPRTKHRIAQNKKMMSELRFQCFEVEKMHRARQGLMKSNTLLLAQAASARFRVEDLARRSHLLQRIIRYMNQKLQSRQASRRDFSTGYKCGDGGGGGGQEVAAGHAQQGWSAGAGGKSGGAGGGDGGRGAVGQRGALYKLAGMSDEERQQMLDLREELRREEVGIAAAQTVAAKMREEMLRADGERSRALAMKTDLARVLALCHEDPLLGADRRRMPRTTSVHTHQFEEHQPKRLLGSKSSASPLLQLVEGCTSSASSRMDGLDLPTYLTGCVTGDEKGFVGGTLDRRPGPESEDTFKATAALPGADRDEIARETQRQQHRKDGLNRPPLQQDQQQQQRSKQEHHRPSRRQLDHPTLSVSGPGEAADRDVSSTEGHSPSAVNESQITPVVDVGGLTLWPESVALPPPSDAEMATGEGNDPEGVGELRSKGAARYMSGGVLRGVARLFLSKLQVSVEAITPRPPAVGSETCAFPALASGTSIDGGGSAFGISTNARQLRLSRRETRNRADNMRAKRKEVGGSFTSGTGDGQRVRRRRSGASSCGIGGGDDGGDNSTLAGGCLTEEGFRGGGQGHEVGTRERGDPDDATCSWSTWHPTGIPSWDILESAVRQTKRQRTRDAACQTLTYRQLRDGANPTPASKRNDPTSCKHSTNNVKPSPEEAQQARPRQGRQQPQESGFHVVPASRLVSMLNPANGPASSATTVSTASVYRVTDGGGIVHGAVVRGGTRSSTDGDERRRGLRQRQTNMAGREGGDGDFSDNVGGAEGFKSREAQTGGVSASTAPQGGRRGDGPTLHSPTEGKNGRELDALPPDGAGMVLCTPVPSTQRQASLLNDPQQRPAQERPAQAPSPLEQHEAIGDRRLSPTLGQVAISWGRETENETAEAMRGSRPSAAKDPAAALSTCSRGGREPVSLRIDRGVWEVGCSDLMSSPQGGGKRGSAGSEGFAYEPLSKGPDYRKVLLFTVDDADCRILRRPHPSPARPEKSDPARLDDSPSRRDMVGTANGRRRGNRCVSRQSGRISAGTNIFRSLSSPAAGKAVEARLAEATAAEMAGVSSDGLGLFIGRNSGGDRDEGTRGVAGGKGSTSVGQNSAVVLGPGGGMEGPDGGRTLCSSVSTLSGEAF